MAAPRSLLPETAQRAAAVARTLVGAARSAALYSPDHPAARSAISRLSAAIADAASGDVVTLGVAPDALLVDGMPVATDGIVAEAAAYLHARDLLRISFTGVVDDDTLYALLRLLAEDVDAVRARGGVAQAWVALGRGGVEIEAIDYKAMLSEPEKVVERKDDLWRTLVRLATVRQATLDEAAEQRLLEIASDPDAMEEFASDITAMKTTPEGAPMVTSQAAAVLAAWRHLNGLIAVLAPERRAEVMRNISTATSTLPSHVVVEMLRQNIADQKIGDDGALAFDEIQVAQLLATALALGGGTSPRLAEVFDTIAPDEPRKRRILTMTRSLLNDTDFGKRPEFDSLWISVEELLLAYNDNAFVSTAYRASLDTAGERAARMATSEAPEEWHEWMDSLGEESVRTLSALLLVDLLKIETDPDKMGALASDLGALAEDLLMSGDFSNAATVVDALRGRGGEACRTALDAVGGSAALADAAVLVGDLDERALAQLTAIAVAIGPASVDGLSRALAANSDKAKDAVAGIIVTIGAGAVSRLAPLVTSDDPAVRRIAARMLGRIGSPDGVPLLQPLLRGRDPDVAREAVRALSSINDPSAARAVQTVLRAAQGPVRDAIVAALVAERDPRVVPVLTSVLDASDPAGEDFDVVIDTLKAIGILNDPKAVPAIDRTIRKKGWRGRRKLRQIKVAGVQTLLGMDAEEARTALEGAAATGDRALKKAAREAAAGAARG
ncbi:MAG: HEAT repeat domain-containing protein [Vicinamibacterales bacterium]